MTPLLVLALLQVSSLPPSAPVEVHVWGNRIWVGPRGAERPVTDDRTIKDYAVLSPAGTRIAYFLPCPPDAVDCTSNIAVANLQGETIRTFSVQNTGSPTKRYGSVLSLQWPREDAIFADCHINPSLNELIEFDPDSGKLVHSYLGGPFIFSRDGRTVAHRGWVLHAAPPWKQSDYLQLNNEVVYPLPDGTKPVVTQQLQDPPTVVTRNGHRFSGIHRFATPPAWSPNGQEVAIADCTYDWTDRTGMSLTAAGGDESAPSCSLVVVDRQGQVTARHEVRFHEVTAETAMTSSPYVYWLDSDHVAVGQSDLAQTYTIHPVRSR